MNEKDILFRILSIVGYKDSKLDFINKFFSYIYTEAIARITFELDEKTNKEIGIKLAQAKNEEEQKTIILQYLSKDKFDALLAEITQAQLTDYLDTIYPKLSIDTQRELAKFLSSLTKP
ncbi:MAG: hypothetical protein UZ22_OP11002000908 [Microgenomates bacterium OLB23]|nr:MAG: hypothetical protein UZ22_OP11002000908 [Microgenomates bacterium OLB23]